MKNDKLMRMLCDEIEEISNKGKLSAGDVDIVHKLIVAKEKLLRSEELEEELGYSNAGYRRDSYGMGRNSYNDSYGRHYVRAHYSRDSIKDKIADMMDSGDLNQSQRMAMQRMMDEL